MKTKTILIILCVLIVVVAGWLGWTGYRAATQRAWRWPTCASYRHWRRIHRRMLCRRCAIASPVWRRICQQPSRLPALSWASRLY